ncbi:branched-chain amino acid ABC transporter permease [Actinomadura sp. NBRC 104412]|uniref:branched-chain amino acid ABC transporter permease n=1 Tax=Actinomadura sp. NBRC 104412 TaxID=3032203 RepID=UPI0024A60433|nr:branched-chain amino acid ABC transporter permease [Actinomadura sp. NBRC 104412]GLZ08410.1 branched-chain amino acid ABC transporter permease [Actinomadura sp. NBRC 104412]
MNRWLDPSLRRHELIAAGCVPAVVLVAVFGSGFAVSFGYQFLIWVALALSWNLFSGNSGYASFGHGVFFGLGTYTAAAVLRSTDVPFVVPLLAAGAVGGVLALVVGLAVFSSPRFAGDLFGLVTLAMAFIVMTMVSNVSFLDGGSGVFVREHTAGTWIGSSTRNLFIVAALLAGLCAVAAVATSTTRWGTALRSIRDDEGVAESLGVPTYRYKVVSFVVSGALAGLAGAPQAVFLGYVEVGAVFALNIPLFVIMMAILGGMGRWWGPVIGAALVVTLREALLGLGSPEMAQIVVGLSLVAVIALMPHGVSGFLSRAGVALGAKGGAR